MSFRSLITVFPFILRGITLFGIDSQNCPMPLRQRAWDMASSKWKFPWLERLASEVPLSGINSELDKIKAGSHRAGLL
jgi:acrylyl-CoA reductase (NADPH)